MKIKFIDRPVGRKDAMRGLTAFVSGVSAFCLLNSIPSNHPREFYDPGLMGLATGTVLFLGYTARSIYKTISSEIRAYRNV